MAEKKVSWNQRLVPEVSNSEWNVSIGSESATESVRDNPELKTVQKNRRGDVRYTCYDEKKKKATFVVTRKPILEQCKRICDQGLELKLDESSQKRDTKQSDQNLGDLPSPDERVVSAARGESGVSGCAAWSEGASESNSPHRQISKLFSQGCATYDKTPVGQKLKFRQGSSSSELNSREGSRQQEQASPSEPNQPANPGLYEHLRLDKDISSSSWSRSTGFATPTDSMRLNPTQQVVKYNRRGDLRFTRYDAELDRAQFGISRKDTRSNAIEELLRGLSSLHGGQLHQQQRSSAQQLQASENPSAREAIAPAAAPVKAGGTSQARPDDNINCHNLFLEVSTIMKWAHGVISGLSADLAASPRNLVMKLRQLLLDLLVLETLLLQGWPAARALTPRQRAAPGAEAGRLQQTPNNIREDRGERTPVHQMLRPVRPWTRSRQHDTPQRQGTRRSSSASRLNSRR